MNKMRMEFCEEKYHGVESWQVRFETFVEEEVCRTVDEGLEKILNLKIKKIVCLTYTLFCVILKFVFITSTVSSEKCLVLAVCSI